MRRLLPFLVLLLALPAYADPPAGPLDPELSKWFRSLTVPGSSLSCCDQADGRITDDVRETPEGYEVKIDQRWGVDPPVWMKVAPNAVLNRVDNPTGRFVVFYAWGSVLCLVRPALT